MSFFKRKNKHSENYTRADDMSKAERHRRYVYEHTKKPQQYVHVDEPKTLQDERQIQFNNWCKRNGVYCGSYLPENPDKLTEKGKGWRETTDQRCKNDDRGFERRSTKQEVAWNKGRDQGWGWEDEHYHWRNPNESEDGIQNLDRYGNPTKDRDKEHLAPLDRDYRFVKHNKTNKKRNATKNAEKRNH